MPTEGSVLVLVAAGGDRRQRPAHSPGATPRSHLTTVSKCQSAISDRLKDSRVQLLFVTRTTDTVVVTLDVPPAVVDDVAARLDEADTEPSRAVVRDRVFDALEISPEFRADGRPVADVVRARLAAGE